MNELTLEQQVKDIINDPKLKKQKYKIPGFLNTLLIGKKFRVKDLNWEPGNKYSGQVFQVGNISPTCNDTIYFVYAQNHNLPAFDLLKDIEIIE